MSIEVRFVQFDNNELAIVDPASSSVDAGTVRFAAGGDGHTPPSWPNAEDALQEMEAVVDFLRGYTAAMP